MRNLVVAVLTTILAACSGTLSTYPLGAREVSTEQPIKNGVIYYPQRRFIETYQFTEIKDRDGKVTHHVFGVDPESECQPLPYRVPAIRIAYDEPWIIEYKPGLLENYKLGVELSDGALSSLNTESAPDRGSTLKSLAEGAGVFLAAGASPTAVPHEYREEPFCNSTPVLIDWERAS